MMQRSRLFSLVLMFVVIAVDQWTKLIAQHHLAMEEPRSYLGDLFRLVYAENHGAFLSLGASLSEGARTAVFTGAVTVGVLALLFVTLRNREPRHLVPLSLVTAGGIGNLIDRYWRDGAVIDFMNVGVGGLRTGIFNVADMAITGGILWLLWKEWRGARKDDAVEAA